MTDRLHQLESGRSIGISAAGDPVSRRLVLLCHPTPGAGGFDPDPLVTSPWGLHLLTLDRPGYGVSTPLDETEIPTIEARADDAAEYIEHSEQAASETQRVDFGAVGLVGWGSGGAVALSLAARHPHLVDKVAIVGTASPKRKKTRDPDSAALEFLRTHHHTIADVEADLAGLPATRLTSLGVGVGDPALADVDERERQGLSNRLDRMLGDATIQGMTGIATDLIALADDTWASELGAITASVQIYQGDDDPVTDRTDAAWFAKRIPDSTVIEVAGGGRLTVATAWCRILQHVSPEHGGIGEAENEG